MWCGASDGPPRTTGAPGWRGRLHALSAVVQASAVYEAASTNKRMQSLYAPRIGPNVVLGYGAERLRSESRALLRNDPFVWRAIQALVAGVVGTGITPQSQIHDRALRESVHRAWTDWTNEASADGCSDIYGVMSLAAEGAFVGGDVFLRRRPRRLSDGLTVPLQIQVLEADYCPLEMNETRPNGHVIRQGIEYDRRGQRVAYHLYGEHPYDTLTGGTGATTLRRVPASEIIHLFECTRPGQQRGEPRLARVIVPAFQLGTYRHAMLTRMEIGAALTGWKRRSINDDSVSGLGALEDGYGTAAAPVADSTGKVDVAMAVGEFRELDPGEEMQLVEAPEIGTTAEAFLYAYERAIAAGIGVTYEAASGDHRGSNYSRSRSAQVDVRALWDVYQWRTFIPTVCEGIWRWWWEAAVLGGTFAADGITPQRFQREQRDLTRVEWIPARREWVDPAKDGAAVVTLINNRLMSLSEGIRERGWDPEKKLREIAADEKLMAELGLTRIVSETPAAPMPEPEDIDDDAVPARRVA